MNIGYGEDSFLGGGIGRDMRWNPNSDLFTSTGAPYFGGWHWIYIFKNERRLLDSDAEVPEYDQGAFNPPDHAGQQLGWPPEDLQVDRLGG